MREFFVNRPDTAAMERLLGSHASDAAGVAVRLAWQAGLLRDEITNLTWDQVDFERNQLQLPARTIPITQMLADYLRSVYRKWTFLTGNSTNNCVICSDRYHKQMQPQAISRIARRVLDEVGQTNVRLVDLRHDYIIRQLEQHDWSYVARITGMEIRSLQLHFAQYLPNGRAGPKHSEKSGDIDEFKLWKILQAEKDTPAGLVLWLTWSMGLTAKNIVSLTWDQVDLEKNLIHLPEGEVPLTAAAKRILAKRLQKRTEDLHVLLSAESKKPMDVSRVSRITRTALIRGGMENWTLRDLWTRYEKSNWEQKITEAIRRSGPITRSHIMELYGQTKSAAYQRLRAMLDKGLLVRVGYKYYLPDSVVPPERQQEALYEYLKKEGFACRKDITTALQIETEQCSALLKHEVDSGNLIKVGQKYYLKES